MLSTAGIGRCLTATFPIFSSMKYKQNALQMINKFAITLFLALLKMKALRGIPSLFILKNVTHAFKLLSKSTIFCLMPNGPVIFPFNQERIQQWYSATLFFFVIISVLPYLRSNITHFVSSWLCEKRSKLIQLLPPSPRRRNLSLGGGQVWLLWQMFYWNQSAPACAQPAYPITLLLIGCLKSVRYRQPISPGEWVSSRRRRRNSRRQSNCQLDWGGC